MVQWPQNQIIVDLGGKVENKEVRQVSIMLSLIWAISGKREIEV